MLHSNDAHEPLYSRVVLRPINATKDDKRLVVHPNMGFDAIAEWLAKEYPGVWPGPGLLAQFVVSAIATGDPVEYETIESWGFELVPIR